MEQVKRLHVPSGTVGPACVTIVLVLLSSGCPRDDPKDGADDARSSSTEGATASRPTHTASAPPPADAAGWVGNWTSKPCGQRTYPRDLELRAKGVALAHDLISPCPPQVACVWSGIISYEGTWELKGERVALKLEHKTYPNMKAAPLPTELSWSGSPVGEEDGVRCAYRAR